MALPSTTSMLVQRLVSAFKAGFAFNGKRDFFGVYGYPKDIRPEEMVAKYERQDIASRIVDMPAEETWTNPPEISADGTFEKAWQALLAKYDLWPILTQADKLCCFDRFSTILVGLPGDPKVPVIASDLEKVLYLASFGAGNAVIDQAETDPKNPRFGQPKQYALTVDSEHPTNIQAHWTRVIHFVDRPLQGNVFGVPLMTKIYNLLDDLLKIGGGSAETYWNIANRGMQVDVDKEMEFDQDDAKNLSEELDEFQHQIRRYVRTRGVKITNLGSDVADPRGVFEVLISLLAAATGIPQRILMGAEAGQLASEQDRANWAEYMERRRKSFAVPYILKPFITRLQALKILPLNTKPLEYKWPEAFHQNPLERAQTMAQFARATINLSRQTQLGFPVVTLQEARRSLGLSSDPENGETLPPAYVPPVDPNAKQDPAGSDSEDDDPKGEGTNARPKREDK